MPTKALWRTTASLCRACLRATFPLASLASLCVGYTSGFKTRISTAYLSTLSTRSKQKTKKHMGNGCDLRGHTLTYCIVYPPRLAWHSCSDSGSEPPQSAVVNCLNFLGTLPRPPLLGSRIICLPGSWSAHWSNTGSGSVPAQSWTGSGWPTLPNPTKSVSLQNCSKPWSEPLGCCPAIACSRHLSFE